MNNPRLKSVVLAAALVLVVVGVSLYILGWERLPDPIHSPVSFTAPSVSISGVMPLAATTTQPKITWSRTSIEVILSSGESTSSDLTFASSLNLSNVVIEPVTSIASFVSIQPSAFASVPANQTQATHISLAIPAGTPLGTYDGTIHLKSGTNVYPEMVKVVISTWAIYKSLRYGYQFSYPNGTVDSLNSAQPVSEADAVSLQLEPNALNLRICASDNSKSVTSSQLLRLWTDSVPPDIPPSLCGAHRKDVRSVQPLRIGNIEGFRARIFAYDHFETCDYVASTNVLLAICIPYDNPADSESEMHSTIYEVVRSTLKFTRSTGGHSHVSLHLARSCGHSVCLSSCVHPS